MKNRLAPVSGAAKSGLPSFHTRSADPNVNSDPSLRQRLGYETTIH